MIKPPAFQSARDEGGVPLSRNVVGQDPAPANRKPITADVVLEDMAATFRERNSVYSNNYKAVAKIMAVLFPDGAQPALLHSEHFHLVELLVVKLTRFAASGAQHIDSIHDAGVYAALIEAILWEKKA